MRIGIDARELCGKPTGVGRHLAGLLDAWAASPEAAHHSFVLYAHESFPPIASSITEVRIVPGPGGTRWEQRALPRAVSQDRLDVFFAPAYTAPLLLKIPSVVLVHDLSFATHPEWFRWKEGLRRRLLTRWSSEHAALVLTVSEAARADILTHFGIAPGRVRCIYPGITSMFAAPPASTREPVVVFAGSIFNRRHVPDLIAGFAPIAWRHPDARLEIAGDNRTYPDQNLPGVVAALGLQSQVALRSYVPDEVLGDLYGRARAFAFLSEYEGFGHPPLEALGSGVPPVLLDTPVAHEVCDGAAVYVGVDDVPGITSALDRLLFDDAVRGSVLAAAPAVLARYSWSRAAAETLEALESAAHA